MGRKQDRYVETQPLIFTKICEKVVLNWGLEGWMEEW